MINFKFFSCDNKENKEPANQSEKYEGSNTSSSHLKSLFSQNYSVGMPTAKK